MGSEGPDHQAMLPTLAVEGVAEGGVSEELPRPGPQKAVGEGLPGDWFLKLRRPEPSGEVKGDR